LENARVIDIVILIGLHIVRCTELDHFTLLCHVTEHTIVLWDVTPLCLTCAPMFLTIYSHRLPSPSLKVKVECVSETSAKICTMSQPGRC